jgi:uncharacterized membrane protein
MNKEKFLKNLEAKLNLLPREEIKEIIEFYNERFERAKFENKSEAQLLLELENPKEIAKNVYEQFGINNKSDDSVKASNGSTNIRKQVSDFVQTPRGANITAVVTFDIFVTSWLLPTLYSLVIAFYGSMLTIISVPVLFFKYPLIEASILSLTIVATALILLVFGNLFLKLSIISTKWIIDWHKFAFTGKRKEKIKIVETSKTKKKKKKSAFKKWTTKNAIAFGFALMLIVVTAVGLLLIDSQLVNSLQGNYRYETNYTPDDLSLVLTDGYDINLNMKSAKVQIEVVDGNFLNVRYEYDNYDDLTYEINTESDVISFVQVDTMKWIDYVFNFQLKDIIIIQIPRNLVVDNLNVNISNGSLKISPDDATHLNINVIDCDIIS